MRFIQRILFISAFLFLSACDGTNSEPNANASATAVTGETTSQEVAKQVSNHPTAQKKSHKDVSSGKHPIWKIQGDHNSVYIMGSIHLLSKDLYPLDEVYQNAYADAERLVFEIDEQLLDQASVQAAVLNFAPLSGAETLEQAIGSEKYAEVKRLAKENNLPMLMFENFDPWFSYVNLSNMLVMNAGYSPESGIDMHFMQRGLSDGKPIDGLETLPEQLNFFEQIPMDQQADMLLEVMQNSHEVPGMLTELVSEWQSGDMDGLAELLLEDMHKTPAMYDLLLKQRNHNWVDKILPLLQEQDDYLIIVGAGHLAGPDSVIKLLQDRGVQAVQF
ncbi:MAG: TraB/GumN family protein [Gammaproteobacteria bacterium]|nr:TraB/GumN family protein [Gammaproteobacteria bacterium]NNC96709.1 TraB/GumN family protein [Gammaproteobacteria bacterium]NNM14523.1 TraB/GumN family protein [Gammaproteobacteria bacterium]